MLPQKMGFAIFVAQKLWNWRPFSQKIPLRGQYISIKIRTPLFKSLGTGLLGVGLESCL